jgi:hypothetical protein
MGKIEEILTFCNILTTLGRIGSSRLTTRRKARGRNKAEPYENRSELSHAICSLDR